MAVFASPLKIERCTSLIPVRKRLWKTLPPTIPSTTPSISGRAPTRSRWALSTRSSVTRVAISALTASSSIATVARSANSSESNSASVA